MGRVVIAWAAAICACEPLLANGQAKPPPSSEVAPARGSVVAGRPYPARSADVRAFGAKGDARADDTAAIQSAIDAAGAGGHVYIPPGIYLVKTIRFTWGGQTITCDGTVQSKDGRSSPVVLVGTERKEKPGRFHLQPRHINGNLRVKGCPDPDNTPRDRIPNIIGILMQNVSWSELKVEVDGCRDGLRLYGDGGGVANNTIYIRRLTNWTGFGVHLDANPEVYSWCNANRFFGGLIAGKSGRIGTGIYVAYSAAHQLNSNVFYAPMIEPARQAIFCDALYTVFHDVRYEAGGQEPNGIEFGPHSAYCRASFVYAGDAWQSQPVTDIGFDSVNRTITGKFNRHDLWPGKVIRLKLKDGSFKHLTVAGVSGYQNGAGRIRVLEVGQPGFPTQNNPIVKLETIGIRDAGRGNETVMGFHLGPMSLHHSAESITTLGGLNLTGYNLEGGASLRIDWPGTGARADRDAVAVLASSPGGGSQVRYKITHNGTTQLWDPLRGELKQRRIGADPSAGPGRQGDIVWASGPEAGGWAGWICVRSGVAGKAVWKRFGAIAP